MTIDVASVLTYPARADNHRIVSSENVTGESACVLDQIPAMRPGAWANYAFGAAWALRERYAVRHGLTGVICGTLPGCGLSSSASVTLAYLHAPAQVNALSLDRWDCVQLVQRVENGYWGLQNGILDQTTIEFGTANALIQIDPRQRTAAVLAASARATAYCIVLAFSGFTRALVASGYNTRVQECQAAARLLGERCGQPAARILSDIPDAVFAALQVAWSVAQALRLAQLSPPA
jgi:galactokinase/galacturonokinase